jgi:hypothetical protein
LCQKNKASNQAQAGLLQPIPPPQQPWDTISMDSIVSLPEDKVTGNNAILVVVDKQTHQDVQIYSLQDNDDISAIS